MPVRATEVGPEKIGEAIPSHCDTHRSATQAKDIQVVVLHPLSSREIVMTKGGSRSGHLIGGHRSSDSAAANQDTPLYFSVRDCLCDRNGEIRIVVAGVVPFISKVDDLMPFLPQSFGEFLLHVEAAVICADTDLHGTLTP